VTWLDVDDDEFVAASRQALRATTGSEALRALGWWHLTGELADDEARRAVFALFRAQGRELASSPALGGLLAQPYLDLIGGTAGSTVAVVTRRSARRGHVHVAVGRLDGMQLLVDEPGVGAWLVPGDSVVQRTVDLPGHLDLREVELDLSRREVLLDDAQARPARTRSAFLGRLAVAAEILGAAEGALALAIDHASGRQQFGRPIGTFQAVRHLLAWAKTDCVAIESAVAQGVALDRAAPPKYDEIVKALAGRNGRRVCERTLQVMGAIGFTAEHQHHHFHSRLLQLDALLGSSADLTAGLGLWLRELGSDPRLPSASLLPTGTS
jgi:hypothetical protein